MPKSRVRKKAKQKIILASKVDRKMIDEINASTLPIFFEFTPDTPPERVEFLKKVYKDLYGDRAVFDKEELRIKPLS